MNLTQIYIELHDKQYDALVRVNYQFMSNYLTLFVSEWLASKKLSLGKFNRLILEEGSEDDMKLSGDRAYVISIRKRFNSLSDKQFSSNKTIHRYFVENCLEGIAKLEQVYKLKLSEELSEAIDKQFSNALNYDCKIEARYTTKGLIEVIHRYEPNHYKLVVTYKNIFTRRLIKEKVIYITKPDPFVVKYDIATIKLGRNIKIFNALGEQHLTFDY